MARSERQRWGGSSLLHTFLMIVVLGVLWFAKRRRGAALGLLLTVHVAAQLFFLGTLLQTLDPTVYRQPPPLLAATDPGELIGHPGAGSLSPFGSGEQPEIPDAGLEWVERRGWFELYPFAGVLHGLQYDLNASPEGLDSFFSWSVTSAIATLGDVRRVRLLRSQGIEALVLDRRLEPEAERMVRLRGISSHLGAHAYVYELQPRFPDVVLVNDVRPAEHMNRSVEILTSAWLRRQVDGGRARRSGGRLAADASGGGTSRGEREGWDHPSREWSLRRVRVLGGSHQAKLGSSLEVTSRFEWQPALPARACWCGSEPGSRSIAPRSMAKRPRFESPIKVGSAWTCRPVSTKSTSGPIGRRCGEESCSR